MIDDRNKKEKLYWCPDRLGLFTIIFTNQLRISRENRELADVIFLLCPEIGSPTKKSTPL